MNTKHRAAIAEACPPEAWREIVEATIVHAKQGDRAAREWLANYLVGRPEGAATTLRAIAVEEVAGTDQVTRDTDLERLLNVL